MPKFAITIKTIDYLPLYSPEASRTIPIIQYWTGYFNLRKKRKEKKAIFSSLAKPAAPMSGIFASLRQAAGHALAVAVQSDEFAWNFDISQGVLALDHLESGCLHGSACGFRKKKNASVDPGQGQIKEKHVEGD